MAVRMVPLSQALEGLTDLNARCVLAHSEPVVMRNWLFHVAIVMLKVQKVSASGCFRG